MTEVIKLASAYGYEVMNLDFVTAITSQQNFKAINLLERASFIKVEVLEEDEVKYILPK